MDYRIIGTDGREYGPVSTDQIRNWIRDGRVHAGTLVRTEASLDWRTLGTLPEFSAFVGPALVPARGDYARPAVRRTNGWAVWSLVCGILALTLCSCCCVPLNLLGIVFAAIALVQISGNPDTQTGTAIAITGLALCVLSLVLGFLMTAFWMAAGGEEFWREFERQLIFGDGLSKWLLMR